MHSQSIATLKKLFDNEELTQANIEDLKSDARKGVQQLIDRHKNKQNKLEESRQNFINMTYYERKHYANGCSLIAGIDEAGRGPLAGPVVAASVILPKDFELLGLTDSKMLNESTRNTFFDIIQKEAISYGISFVSSQKIDEINIYEATKLAMQQAVNQLDPQPDHVLIDAMRLDGLPCTSESIIKGDQKSVTIAAASVLAKVARDRFMHEVHNEYPVYDFLSNKGYGTKHHMSMLETHGITTYHRKSYAPVRSAMK